MDQELTNLLRLGIKALIFQEVRLHRMEQHLTPQILLDEISHSIQEIKREIVQIARELDEPKRAMLLRTMIQEAIDEEIDRSVQFREKKCLRCIHGRFYDRVGEAFSDLPPDGNIPEGFGCDQVQPALQKTCQTFVEISTGHSLEEYLDDLSFLYEVREWFDRIEEIWKDYLTK